MHRADARQRKLLDAALTVFLRYGYRKTSMDETYGMHQDSTDALRFWVPQMCRAWRRSSPFFVVDALTDDGIHEEEVWNLMTSGRDPFLPGAYEKLRARVVDGKVRQKPQ